MAQFGRGVLGDVSAKLMGQFVDNLEEMLSESAEADAGDESADDGGDGAADAGEAAAEPEAVDLLQAVPRRLRILSPIIAPVLALGLLLKRLVDFVLKPLSGRRGAE